MKIVAKDNLLEVIFKNGDNISSFAKKVGVSRQSIHFLLNGRSGINPTNAKKYLEVLGVEFDEVFEIIKN